MDVLLIDTIIDLFKCKNCRLYFIYFLYIY
jgi:hypothetical protein